MIRDGDTDTVTATRLNRFVSCGALCLSRSECLAYSPVLISTVIKGFSQMRAFGDLIRVMRYNTVRSMEKSLYNDTHFLKYWLVRAELQILICVSSFAKDRDSKSAIVFNRYKTVNREGELILLEAFLCKLGMWVNLVDMIGETTQFVVFNYNPRIINISNHLDGAVPR